MRGTGVRLACLAVAAVGAGAAVTGAGPFGGSAPTGAAFVDEAVSAQELTADRVQRWLGLEAAGAGAACAAPTDVAVAGRDETLKVAVGGADLAGDTGEREASCAFLLRARDELPEGVERITVTAGATGPEGPLRRAAITGLDGSGASDAATLGPGETLPVRLTVARGAAATGSLSFVVSFTGETSGFLRYDIPVTVCDGAVADTCRTEEQPPPPPPPPPGGGTDPGASSRRRRHPRSRDGAADRRRPQRLGDGPRVPEPPLVPRAREAAQGPAVRLGPDDGERQATAVPQRPRAPALRARRPARAEEEHRDRRARREDEQGQGAARRAPLPHVRPRRTAKP